MKALSPDPCENCGGEVFSTVRKDGKPRKQRYCGLKCGAAYRKEKERGQAWHRLEYEIARIQSKRRRWYWRRCKWCSEWYSPGRDRGTCCSTKCAAYVGANTAGRIGRITDGSTHYHMMQREIGAIQRIGTMQRKRSKSGSLVKKCSVCGRPFISRTWRRTCSKGCSKVHEHARTHGDGVRCVVCSAYFCKVPGTSERRNTSTHVCSEECIKTNAQHVARVKAEGKRNERSLRRAHERGAMPRGVSFDIYGKVFDRDEWKCRACGIDTPYRLRGTYEPDAPELDHIIPLARGGWHAPDNCQCLCRKCNANKGALLPSEWKINNKQRYLF
jgi:5-methylcytosine-specific restriction endonuclease McrA